VFLQGHRAVALVGIVVCWAHTAEAQVAGQHPDPKFLVRAARESEVRLSGAASSAPAVMAPRALARIGTEDGDAATVFGDMITAAVIDDSTIAIIDGSASEVRLFSRSGQHLQTFGRAGSGPGEFRGATALVRAPDGALIVADSRRLLQFFYPKGRGFEYRRTVTLPVAVRSMCFLGRTLVVNGASFEEGKIIRVLDANGAVVRAFGEVYRSQNPLLNYQASQGRIACDAARQLIYYMAGSLLGEVRAYRPNGEEVWRVRVSDYRTNIVREQSGGSVQLELSPTGTHSAGGIALLGGSGLLAQWSFRTRAQVAAKDPAAAIHSAVINPETGRATYVGTSLPLLRDLSDKLALVYTPDLVPQLEVRTAQPRVGRGAP